MPYIRRGMGQGCDYALDPTCGANAPVYTQVTGILGGEQALQQIEAAAPTIPSVSPTVTGIDPAAVAEAALAPLGGISGAVGWVAGGALLIGGLLLFNLLKGGR